MFALVLRRRMGRVVAAEKEFSDAHSRATGVIADTIANLTTVRSQAAEEREKAHVGRRWSRDSLAADLRARRVFTTTRIQMESAMAFFNWAAVVVGVVLALHHVAAAGAVYLILFYATFVGTSLEESFEFIRLHLAGHRTLRQVRRHRRRPSPTSSTCPGPRTWSVPRGPGRVPRAALRLPARGVRSFDGLDLSHRAGRARRPGRAVGLGQDDADQAAAALRRS